MESPFYQEGNTADVTPRELRTDVPSDPKISFRPPALSETQVVTDPFARVSPRLRVMEFFGREVRP